MSRKHNEVARNLKDPRAYIMRGTVFGQARRHDEALADVTTAISIDPAYAQAYANRGLVYREAALWHIAWPHFYGFLTCLKRPTSRSCHLLDRCTQPARCYD